MKKSYIIIGIVVILMLAAAGIYARINKATAKNENPTNVENNVNSQNTENSEKNNESGGK